jgi:hypothetical protein
VEHGAPRLRAAESTRAAAYLFDAARPLPAVPLRRREVELSVDREIDPGNPAAGTARVSARFEVDGAPASPTHAELAEAFERLKGELDGLLGTPLAGAIGTRPDRSLTELVETYRPRRRELIDALRDDGELTRGEHERLATYLTGIGADTATVPPVPTSVEPAFDRPIAAVPIAADRAPERARPVEDLLREYQIVSLKQAGAVRARREISFEEYMALKRHFQKEETPEPKRPT